MFELLPSPLRFVPMAEMQEDIFERGHVECPQQLGRAIFRQKFPESHHAHDVSLAGLLDVVRRDHDGRSTFGNLENIWL